MRLLELCVDGKAGVYLAFCRSASAMYRAQRSAEPSPVPQRLLEFTPKPLEPGAFCVENYLQTFLVLALVETLGSVGLQLPLTQECCGLYSANTSRHSPVRGPVTPMFAAGRSLTALCLSVCVCFSVDGSVAVPPDLLVVCSVRTSLSRRPRALAGGFFPSAGWRCGCPGSNCS